MKCKQEEQLQYVSNTFRVFHVFLIFFSTKFMFNQNSNFTLGLHLNCFLGVALFYTSVFFFLNQPFPYNIPLLFFFCPCFFFLNVVISLYNLN